MRNCGQNGLAETNKIWAIMSEMALQRRTQYGQLLPIIATKESKKEGCVQFYIVLMSGPSKQGVYRMNFFQPIFAFAT